MDRQRQRQHCCIFLNGMSGSTEDFTDSSLSYMTLVRVGKEISRAKKPWRKGYRQGLKFGINCSIYLLHRCYAIFHLLERKKNCSEGPKIITGTCKMLCKLYYSIYCFLFNENRNTVASFLKTRFYRIFLGERQTKRPNQVE